METAKRLTKYFATNLKSGKNDPDFFEFIRKLEQAAGEGSVGSSANVNCEPVRFGQLPYLHFPETSIAEITEHQRTLVLIYFMGLTGVNGPMPLEFTNYVFQRAHNNYDFTLQRFLDIFNHRFIGLFYRAWKLNEQAAGFDAPNGGLISCALRCLSGDIGYDTALPSEVNAYWNGLFGLAAKSRDGLELLLQGYFRLPIKIIDREVSRADIPEAYRCRLGHRSVAELGKSIQLGMHFYSRTQKFTIEVGPVTFAKACFLLPGNHGFQDLIALICRYLDRPIQYDLKIILQSDTLPLPKLGANLQLGRNIWLPGNREKQTLLTLGASRLTEKSHRDFTNLHKETRSCHN